MGNSYKYIYVLVEGPTEESFVSNILEPYFYRLSIYIKPVIIGTSRDRSGKKYKGGVTSYNQVKKDLIKLIYNPSIDLITTMIDYYKLPGDFPGFKTLPDGSFYDRVNYLEERFREDIKDCRFIPYLQVHEFEAYLFSSAKGFNRVFFDEPKGLKKIKTIIEQFNNPEAINDGENTAPSKRIKSIFSSYSKVDDGVKISANLGLDTIRKSCSHFNEWIEKLTAKK